MKRSLCARSATIALVFLAGTSPASADLVLDTFAEFDSAFDQTADGASVTSNTARPVFGGQRRLVADSAGPIPGIAQIAAISNGFGQEQFQFDQFGTGSGSFGTAHLVYDGDPAGLGTSVDPTNIADTDFTLDGHSIILRDLAVNGDGIDLRIDVYDGATVSSFTTELANNPTPTDFFVDFNLFSDPTVFTSVNAIVVSFDGLPGSGSLSGRGSDLSFSSLLVGVPEPSSLAMLGVACAGLFFRRRRVLEPVA
jgi:hypothetical protein